MTDYSSRPHGAAHILALDVGTTTVRALLFDLDGRPIAEAACEPALHHPRPNWAEIDAEERWTCCLKVMRHCLTRSGLKPVQVAAIGLTGLMHALVPLDATGKALAPAMLWMDQRCRGQAERMTSQHGDTIQRIMGRSQVRTTWSAPKLRWISEQAPHLMAQTHLFLPIQSLIAQRLTGVVATDPSNAGGTFLYDRARRDWSAEMLQIVGVPREKLPPIVPPTTVVGGLLESAADETGLLAGTPVVIGGSDVSCTRIGANADGNGRACLYLGTAAWVSLQRASGPAFGASATTGAALRWLVHLFGQDVSDHPGDA